MSDTIWNSDKFAADTRPDWVKAILKGGHKVTAFPENGRWYFEPTIPNSDLPVGTTINLYFGEKKIPSIWNGKKWLDMRLRDGRDLYDKTRGNNASPS